MVRGPLARAPLDRESNFRAAPRGRVRAAYRGGVSGPAELPGEVVPPASDPQSIRACLTTSLVAEFDREWDLVLDEAKRDEDLQPIQSLLVKWRHLAYAELKDQGSHYRMLAKAEEIMRAGRNPDAGSIEDMRALIDRRLGR